MNHIFEESFEREDDQMDDTMDDSKRNWVSHPLGINRDNFYKM